MNLTFKKIGMALGQFFNPPSVDDAAGVRLGYSTEPPRLKIGNRMKNGMRKIEYGNHFAYGIVKSDGTKYRIEMLNATTEANFDAIAIAMKAAGIAGRARAIGYTVDQKMVPIRVPYTRYHSIQFKRDAVALMEEMGSSLKAGIALGVSSSTLRKWRLIGFGVAENLFDQSKTIKTRAPHTRRTFSAQFKNDAVALMGKVGGYKAGKAFDIHSWQITKWKKLGFGVEL